MVSENKHLSDVLEHYREYVDDGKKAPDMVLANLLGELKVSKLLAPVVAEEDRFILDQVSVDSKSYLPLYTNMDEFRKHTDSDIILGFPFRDYLDIVCEEDLEGIAINYESDCLTFDIEFLKQISGDAPLNVTDNGEAYPAGRLREIFESATDADFYDNFSREDIFALLSNTTILNIVYSEESLDEMLEDGILDGDKVGEFKLCTLEDGDIHLVPVFTSKESLKNSLTDDGMHYYGQITRMSNLIDYILENDLDGFIINPNGDEKYIHRDDLLTQAKGIELIVEDSRFDDAPRYAFKL